MSRSSAAAMMVLAGVTAASAAPAERWAPLSKTAQSITGPIRLSSRELSMMGRSYALHPVRIVDAASLPIVGKSFGATSTPTHAQLYGVNVPVRATMLAGNTLCARSAATWLVVVSAPGISGPDLTLAFFSGANEPALDPGAVGQSTAFCGTYTYAR